MSALALFAAGGMISMILIGICYLIGGFWDEWQYRAARKVLLQRREAHDRQEVLPPVTPELGRRWVETIAGPACTCLTGDCQVHPENAS